MFIAISIPDDEVDDAEVVDLLVRLVVRHVLLFLLDLPHQLLGFVRLRRHDVRDAQVGQHDGADGQDLRRGTWISQSVTSRHQKF